MKHKKPKKWMSSIFFLFFASSLFPLNSFGQPTEGGSVRLPDEQAAPSQPSVPAPTPAPSPAPSADAGYTAGGSDEMIYLNVIEQDIKDVIFQISKATGRNFIIDDKVKGKVTIISERTMTKEEAYQAFLSALEVAGYTTVTGPGGIIKIVSTRDAVSSPVPIHLDTTPYTDSFVTRLVKLENISALEMSQAIRGLVSKDGNMFAYPATNTLIITDSGTNIDRLMKIIKELDQEGPEETVEIIPIRHADAKNIAQMVLSLFNTKSGTPQAGAKRAQGEEVEEVSKIIADERTNSIIAVASKRGLVKVHEIIDRLDRSVTEGGGQVHVHYLKYANATKMAATLSSVASKGGVQKEAKGGAPIVAQFEGGVSIGADETTNALIISASPKDYKLLLEELINKLDIPRRQVYLESVVMEISTRKEGSYGATGYGGVGKGPILGFGNVGSSGFNALSGLFAPASFFATPGLLGGLLGRDNISITVPNSSGGTTNLTLPSFSAFLNLIQVYTDADLVSAPNILTLDNEEAEIAVTSKIYAKTQTASATGIITTTPTPLEAGLTLKITPQITEGDMVRLKIAHEQSNFVGLPDNVTGAAPSTQRKINTTVIAENGQTVVLGGLMQDMSTKSKSKVPFLGDIPVLGFFFQNTSARRDKSNLLVFITPHVVRDPSGFAEIMEKKIEQRNQFIEQNYGKKRQKDIKKMISTHRADLLKYTPPVKIEQDQKITPADVRNKEIKIKK